MRTTAGTRGRRRVGWVVADQLARSVFCRAAYLTSGGVGLHRYGWLAAYVNARAELGLHHEIYRPWRRYDAIVFLKSMGPRSMSLLRRRRARGCRTVFDANVHYYERAGVEHYRGMLPSAEQQAHAVAITRAADAVIADSEFLEARCRAYNRTVTWIPDNVDFRLVPAHTPWRADGAQVPLLWCGEAVKLFELLAIEEVLVKFAPRIRLVLVTNALSALERWPDDRRARFERLLRQVPHTLLPYEGIPALFRVYAGGGVAIAPRFLDNSYNLGHTEWKLTLAMACGRVALGSPVPSYVRVAERAGQRGIGVCKDAAEWEAALDRVLSGPPDWAEEERAARAVVERHYATSVVAREHAAFLHAVLAGPPGGAAGTGDG